MPLVLHLEAACCFALSAVVLVRVRVRVRELVSVQVQRWVLVFVSVLVSVSVSVLGLERVLVLVRVLAVWVWVWVLASPQPVLTPVPAASRRSVAWRRPVPSLLRPAEPAASMPTAQAVWCPPSRPSSDFARSARCPAHGFASRHRHREASRRHQVPVLRCPAAPRRRTCHRPRSCANLALPCPTCSPARPRGRRIQGTPPRATLGMSLCGPCSGCVVRCSLFVVRCSLFVVRCVVIPCLLFVLGCGFVFVCPVDACMWRLT